MIPVGLQSHLEGSASDEEAVACRKVEECLPTLRAPVLDHVGLVQYQILPLATLEDLHILHPPRAHHQTRERTFRVNPEHLTNSCCFYLQEWVQR